MEGVVATLSLSSLRLLSSSDNLLLSSSRYSDNLRGEGMWLRGDGMWLRGDVTWLRGDVMVASMFPSHSVDLSAVRTFSVETAISGMLLWLVTMVTKQLQNCVTVVTKPVIAKSVVDL